jgi:hypothetical protein
MDNLYQQLQDKYWCTDNIQLMNILQDRGLISDECIYITDVALSDLYNALYTDIVLPGVPLME